MKYPDDYVDKIICGDCLEVMKGIPDGAVDLVLTDPPYGINLNTNNQRFSGGSTESIAKRGTRIGTAGGQKIINDDKPFDPTFLLGYGKLQIIWGWNHFANKLPRGACLVWIKRNDHAFGSFLSDAEIAWFSKGYGVYCRRDLSNNSIARTRTHPTQKPVSLMVWCIEMATSPGDLVLDPFLGSGTTAVACKLTHRHFIGIEINPDYCKIAEDRLRQGVLI